MKKYYVTDVETEIAVFEKTGMLAVINNTQQPKETDLYIEGVLKKHLELTPMELKWINYGENL